MRLAFTRSAESDLGGIIDYIEFDNPAAAVKVFRVIFATTHGLTDFPEMGQAGRLPETREILVTGMPYLIVFQVTADNVTVVAVFHGARDLTHALAERRTDLSCQ